MENKPNIVVCGTNILGVNNDRQNPWAFPSVWSEILLVSYIVRLCGNRRSVMPPISRYCDILTGCCLMVRLDFIAALGYFDENVFLYCEEIILGRQVKQHKKRMYYLHEVTAIHHHIESAKGSLIKRYKLFWKSRWYYLKKYSSYNKFILLVIFLSQKMCYFIKMFNFKIKRIK